jgi:LCP family protein required for cell wall assembly
LSLVALLVFGLVWGLGQIGDIQDRFTRVDAIPSDLDGRSNRGIDVVLTGVDSREGDNAGAVGEQQQDIGSRTDTIMLMHAGNQGTVIVSIPRDTWVELPECASQSGTRREGMVNSALPLGGPSCLVRTVSELADLSIEHYASIDFAGVVEMVNALGGVPVCVTAPISDPKANGLNLKPGTTWLNGDQALGFVRSRTGWDDLGDLGRV